MFENLGLNLIHLWIIVGIVLATAEIFIPGFAVMCLGIGAFGGAGAAYLNWGWEVQAGVFCAVSLLCVVLLRPIALKFLYQSEDKIATNTQALVGKRAKVIDEIPGNMEKGRVKVEGEEWNALSKIDLPIPAGQYVIVRQVDGNKLIVEMEKD